MYRTGVELFLSQGEYYLVGSKYTIKRKIGELIADIGNCRLDGLAGLITNYPYTDLICTKKNIYGMIEWLHGELPLIYNEIVSPILINEIESIAASYLEEKTVVLNTVEEDIDEYIENVLKENGYSATGDSCLKHFFLSVVLYVLNYSIRTAASLLRDYISDNSKIGVNRAFSDWAEYQSIDYHLVCIEGEIRGVYTLLSSLSLASFELANMIENNTKIKECKNCGNFFVPSKRADELYCDGIAPQDENKTCKEYGAIKTYQDNLKTNEAMGLYRKIYMSKQMLAKRHKDILEYQESFNKYREQAKQWKKEVKIGTKTESEYIVWLKEIKEKKILKE